MVTSLHDKRTPKNEEKRKEKGPGPQIAFDHKSEDRGLGALKSTLPDKSGTMAFVLHEIFACGAGPGTVPVSIARQIQIIVNVAQKTRTTHCPASWDKALPGKFASGELVQVEATLGLEGVSFVTVRWAGINKPKKKNSVDFCDYPAGSLPVWL